MTRSKCWHILLVSYLPYAGALAACDEGAVPAGPEGRLEIHAAPLSLPDISGASYTITVKNAVNQTVFS